MAKHKKIPSKVQIVEEYKSGELIDDIFDRFDFGVDADFDSIVETCVGLHEAGEIDLLALTKSPKLEAIEGHRFFIGQRFFCKAIPNLSASTDEMMQCVQTLVQKGGSDLASNYPNAAFREWCEADLSRAQDVIDAAKKDDPLAIDFLTFALTAGNLVEEAKDFVEKYIDNRRHCGVTALGRMNYATPTEARGALSTLLSALGNEADDRLFANVLMSALDIVENTDQITCDEAIGIIKRVCVAPGSHTHFCCARALWQHVQSLSEDAVALLLQALNSLDPSNKGTIRELDNGLQKLLNTTFEDRAIEFLAKLLSSPEKNLNLSEFQSFGRGLIEGPKERFHTVFISWMLLGEPVLCDGINDLLRHADRGERAIDLPLEDFNLSPRKQIFLCRKTIGYLFLQPVVAASVLVSVLRICDDNVAETVRNLLFDPLLVNYSGSVRDYLSGIDSQDAAHPHIQAALKQSEVYLDDLKSAGNIKELHPSEHERQIEYLRFHDQMQQAYKEAEKKSVLLSLVSRSVILYGHKTLTYVQGPGNEHRPVEMELQPHSTTAEIPRMDIIDPIGLDYMLRVFRIERLKS